MPTLSDGLALVRIAEDVADLGAADVLTEETIATVVNVAREPESRALVARQLADEGKADEFIDGTIELAETGAALSDDEQPRFVSRVAALGSLIVSASTEQTTGTFEAVAVA